MNDAPLVIVGTASAELGERLQGALGHRLTERVVLRFPDGELHVAVSEDVRGRTVFLVQSTGTPVGEALLELLLLADACRRAGALRLVAVIPYLGYARQDRRRQQTEALGMRVIASVLGQARFDRIVVVDLHAPSSEGCFDCPIDHVSAMPALAEALADEPSQGTVVVAPDAGAAPLARTWGHRLGRPVAIVHKERVSGAEVAAHHVIGEVAGRTPILVDDIVATGGTIAAAIEALRARGAAGRPIVVASHLVPHAGGPARLRGTGIARLVTTDSLPAGEPWPFPVDRVSLAPLLADAIGRLHHGAAASELTIPR